MTRSGRYRVWHVGKVLIKRARNPEHEACRALAAQGISGRLETRWRGKGVVAMRMDIETDTSGRSKKRRVPDRL